MEVGATSIGHFHVDVGLGIILRVEVGLFRDLLVNVGLRLRLSIVGLSLYLGINVGLRFGLSRNASRGTHSQCKKGDLNV
jgi:hypothetical protein